MRAIATSLTLLATVVFSPAVAADDSKERSPELQVLDRFVGTWDVRVTARPAGGEAAEFDAVSIRKWSSGGKFVVFDDPQEDELHMPLTYSPKSKKYTGVMILGVDRSIVTATWDEKTKTMHFVIESIDSKTTYKGTHRFIREDYAEAAGKVFNAAREIVTELAWKQTRRKKASSEDKPGRRQASPEEE